MDTPESRHAMSTASVAVRRRRRRRCSPASACWPLGRSPRASLHINGLPPAHEALRELPAILADPEALLNIAASLRRMADRLRAGACCCVPVGLMMGRSRLVAAFFNPLLMIIYPVPKAALMPIIMLWLGVGDASKTLVIFLGVSLPVIYHSYQGARAVEEKMLWSAAAMGMGPPHGCCASCCRPRCREIFVGIRTGLVLALITMVTSEMIARQAGVGNILFNALDMAQYDTVYAMIVIIGVLGFVLDVGFERLRARLVAWAEPVHEIAVGTRHDAARRTGEVLHRRPADRAGPRAVAGHRQSGMAPPSLLPPPAAVFARLVEQLGQPVFLGHAATTLFRLFAGFAIARRRRRDARASRRRAAARRSAGQAAWCACWRRCRRSRSIRRSS